MPGRGVRDGGTEGGLNEENSGDDRCGDRTGRLQLRRGRCGLGGFRRDIVHGESARIERRHRSVRMPDLARSTGSWSNGNSTGSPSDTTWGNNREPHDLPGGHDVEQQVGQDVAQEDTRGTRRARRLRARVRRPPPGHLRTRQPPARARRGLLRHLRTRRRSARARPRPRRRPTSSSFPIPAIRAQPAIRAPRPGPNRVSRPSSPRPTSRSRRHRLRCRPPRRPRRQRLLPFTGVDVKPFLFSGLTLIALGLSLLARRRIGARSRAEVPPPDAFQRLLIRPS